MKGTAFIIRRDGSGTKSGKGCLANRVAYQRRHWISFTRRRARSTVAAYALTWASVLRRRTRQMNAVCGLCLRLGAWRPCSAKADKSS